MPGQIQNPFTMPASGQNPVPDWGAMFNGDAGAGRGFSFPNLPPNIGPTIDGSGGPLTQSGVPNEQDYTLRLPGEAAGTPTRSGPTLEDLRPIPFDPNLAGPVNLSDPATVSGSYGAPSASSGGNVNSGASASGASVNSGAANIEKTGDIPYEGYDAVERELSDDAKASVILDRITAKDSPLMQRAKQEGILMAARRGLQNSSIAAGTAMGAMVDRATPLAIQEAQSVTSMELQNQQAANQAAAFGAAAANAASLTKAQLNSGENIASAQLTSNEAIASASNRTSASIASAQIRSNEAVAGAQIRSNEALANAQLQHQTNILNAQQEQFNANWVNQISTLRAEMEQQNKQFNAAQQNAIDMRVMELNQALNLQYLSGTQALDLATIQGQYASLISRNEMAGNLFSTYMNSLAIMMANENIDPGRVASNAQIQLNMLNEGLAFIEKMNSSPVNTGTSPTWGGSTSGGNYEYTVNPAF